MARTLAGSIRNDRVVPFSNDGYSRVSGLDNTDFDVTITTPDGRMAGVTLIADVGQADNTIGRDDVLIKEIGSDGEYQLRWSVGKDAAGALQAGTWTLVLESDAYQLRWSVDHDSVLTLEGDPDATEDIKIIAQDSSADGLPRTRYLIKASGGGKVDWGSVDVNGERTLYLPPATDYKVVFTKPGYTFLVTTFNVIAGTNPDVTVTGTTAGVLIAGT